MPGPVYVKKNKAVKEPVEVVKKTTVAPTLKKKEPQPTKREYALSEEKSSSRGENASLMFAGK